MDINDEKMVYSAFAMQALIAKHHGGAHKSVAEEAWKMAQYMLDEKPDATTELS